jgi:hypothetical protein
VAARRQIKAGVILDTATTATTATLTVTATATATNKQSLNQASSSNN